MKAAEIRDDMTVHPLRRRRRYRESAVTWRRRDCGCRLLRAWVDAAGWHVVGDDYFLLGDWESATNSPSPARQWDLHTRRGVVFDLPPDPAGWDRNRPLPVGCEHIGATDVHLGRLADSALAVLAFQTRADQRIEVSS